MKNSLLYGDNLPVPPPVATITPDKVPQANPGDSSKADIDLFTEDIKNTRISVYEKLLGFWAPFYTVMRHNTKVDELKSVWTPGIVARCFLNFIQTYLLPLFYVTLGAIPFFLRRLVEQSHSYTYR